MFLKLLLLLILSLIHIESSKIGSSSEPPSVLDISETTNIYDNNGLSSGRFGFSMDKNTSLDFKSSGRARMLESGSLYHGLCAPFFKRVFANQQQNQNNINWRIVPVPAMCLPYILFNRRTTDTTTASTTSTTTVNPICQKSCDCTIPWATDTDKFVEGRCTAPNCELSISPPSSPNCSCTALGTIQSPNVSVSNLCKCEIFDCSNHYPCQSTKCAFNVNITNQGPYTYKDLNKVNCKCEQELTSYYRVANPVCKCSAS